MPAELMSSEVELELSTDPSVEIPMTDASALVTAFASAFEEESLWEKLPASDPAAAVALAVTSPKLSTASLPPPVLMPPLDDVAVELAWTEAEPPTLTAMSAAAAPLADKLVDVIAPVLRTSSSPELTLDVLAFE